MIFNSDAIMSFVPAAPHDSMFQPLHEDGDLPSSCPPHDYHGVSPFLMRRSMSFSGLQERCDQEGCGEDDMSDDGSQLGEKKRRLNLEQVKALEKSFELGNKLEPERKMQLARALGLQPRQIAIWFQNRRARWKTKQLEKDYDILKRQFDTLKADNDALKAQNNKLHSELMVLKNRESTVTGAINLNRENEGSWSNDSENSIDINLITAAATTTAGTTSAADSPTAALYSHPNGKHVLNPSIGVGPTSLTQVLFQNSSSSRSELQFHKIDPTQTATEEGLCNMFTAGIEEQHSFWPWPEQRHFIN